MVPTQNLALREKKKKKGKKEEKEEQRQGRGKEPSAGAMPRISSLEEEMALC